MIKHTLKIWHTTGFLKYIWLFFNIMHERVKQDMRFRLQTQPSLELGFSGTLWNEKTIVLGQYSVISIHLCAFVKGMLYRNCWWGIYSENKNAFIIFLAQGQLHSYFNIIFSGKFRSFISYTVLFLL